MVRVCEHVFLSSGDARGTRRGTGRCPARVPEPILEVAQTPLVKEQLRQQNERALRLGIFGAPTLVVGDELFWGGDRIEEAMAWHARPSKSVVPVV